MSDSGDVLPAISFTFEYEGYGWAHASISAGAETYGMGPSYVGGDPLFLLVQAVVGILRNGDQDTGCEWWYEPALDRWHLHRQGDTLHITIRGRRDGHPSSDAFSPAWFWSHATAGEVRFRTACDLWAFAAQVRDAVRQLKSVGADDPRDNPRRVRRTAEYRALREFLDEHQRTEEQASRLGSV
jgi:hypothetical protein